MTHPPSRRVVLVAAVADNGVIGVGGDVPWHIPEDLRHFRRTTIGHTVLMGRVTYEAIGRPLSERVNVVVTRNRSWTADGVHVAHSVREGLDLAHKLPGDIMVIGGGQVYAEALPLADTQVLTEVHQSPDGDTYYPDFDRAQWSETRRDTGDGYDIVWLDRATTPVSLGP